MKLRVGIADDHAMVRQGLVTFLGLYDDIEVVGQAESGADAIELCRRSRPDVLLLDLVMPGMDGVEVIRGLRAAGLDLPVVVLTSFLDDERGLSAIREGAVGYLMKDVQPDALYRALHGARRGEPQLHPQIARKLLSQVAGGGSARGAERTGADTLTARERDVLARLARGMSNKEIAADLYVSEKTVKTHVSNILQKLGLADRTQAALYAVRHGLAE